MKTANYLLITLFLTFSLISCSEDENPLYVSDVENKFTAFSVDNNYQFADDTINLIVEEGYSNIEVVPVDSMATTDFILINEIDDLNYTISLTEEIEANELIRIKATDTDGNEFTGYSRIFFHEHGTKDDFVTVEGIVIGTDTHRKITALHGEPEDIYIRETSIETNVNEDGDQETVYTQGIEIWNYFSKGLTFTIDSRTEKVTDILVYGIEGTILRDDVSYDVVPYAYELDEGLSKFDTSEGVLMDEIIAKYGDGYEAIEGSNTNHIYAYDNLIFTFSSDNVDEYQGKRVLRVAVSE